MRRSPQAVDTRPHILARAAQAQGIDATPRRQPDDTFRVLATLEPNDWITTAWIDHPDDIAWLVIDRTAEPLPEDWRHRRRKRNAQSRAGK